MTSASDDSTRPLAGKVALVTGAARRVGRAIALELAERGAAIAVHHHRSRAEADALVAELRVAGRDARALAADLRDPAGCHRLVDDAVAWKGRLDVLVNNAATFDRVAFLDPDEARWETAWRDALAVDLTAPARLCRRAAPVLATHHGVIVNVLDVAVWQSWPHYTAHGAAKAGLTWLTRTLAVALAPQVRSVGVAPGIAEFPDDLDDEARRRLVSRVPLGRPGTPEELARAVAYLVTAEYVNGTVLVVDGGRLAATGEGV